MTEGTAFILRAEGVNFAATLLDTQDISTIRGAGLALLALGDAVAAVLKHDADVEDIRLIYAGASQAAFSFRAKAASAEAVRDRIAAALASPHRKDQLPLEHLSFVVDVVADDGAAALAHAEARNHARQFRQWTVALPEFSESNARPDTLDRTRPARMKHAGDTAPLSISTAARREFGRKMRQKFYEKEVGEPAAGLRFADSFEDIIAKPPNDPQLPLSLNAAIAVIYGDGNGFTRIRDELKQRDAQGPETFAREVTACRSALLAHSLNWFSRGSAGGTAARFANNGALRFETLLWGGDDLMFVMPAWLAVAFLEGVLALTRDWTITAGTGDAGEPIRLTHSFGVVIAHYKTPIRLARQLAHEIVDSVKDACRSLPGPPGDAVGIEVFESLIPPQDSLSAYRSGLYGTAVTDLPLHLVFPGDRFALLRGEQPLREERLPRSQLYRALRAARACGDGVASLKAAEAAGRILDDYYKRVRHRSMSDPMRTEWHLPDLVRQGERKRPEGLHLALLGMLWDYLDPFTEQPLPPFLPVPASR